MNIHKETITYKYISMMFVWLLVLGTTIGLTCSSTVPELDVNKYIGLWYQMYADNIVYNTFEKDSFCDTANYDIRTDGKIGVHNYAKIGAPNGTDYVIDGYAYIVNSNEPGKLKVHFDSDKAAPFDASYWVLALGPVNKDNLYDWSIVSDNVSQFLFVLARNIDDFNKKYDEQILNMLNELGFIGRKQPLPTYQKDDCVYEM